MSFFTASPANIKTRFEQLVMLPVNISSSLVAFIVPIQDHIQKDSTGCSTVINNAKCFEPSEATR